MTLHKALHPRYDVDRRYVSRKGWERGLDSIEDSVDESIHRLEDYMGKHERRLITAIRNNTDNTIDNRNTMNRKQKWKEKQHYLRFKRLINVSSHDKTWTWLRKGDFKRETESLLIAAQSSAIRTNNIKARIDKIQQNSKCRLRDDLDETINHIICEYSKLAQKEYKTRHDWVGKVIYRQMCKKFKFDHVNKWYKHIPATVLENDTHKLLWAFGTQTDHLISARRPDVIIINKEKRIWNHRIKLKECEKKNKYLDLVKELKKLRNMRVIIVSIVIDAFGTTTKGLLKGPGGLGSWQTSADHPNDSLFENGLNTEKSPGDLGYLLSLKLQWKTPIS